MDQNEQAALDRLMGAYERVSQGLDVLVYLGQISRLGYGQVCRKLASKPTKRNGVLLIICTIGGDAHAAYRIARALRHNYPKAFSVMVPGLCKSAGTLLVIGAGQLVIFDEGELGPLDVQVAKRDEIFEFGSGLDIMQSLASIQQQAMDAFRDYLMEIRLGAGITTKMAAEMATNLVTGMYSPISAQVDPLRLGEMQRAVEIAMAYGERLDGYEGNLKRGSLERIVSGYPSHGFVIDRKEARELFQRVRAPKEDEAIIGNVAHAHYRTLQHDHQATIVKWFEEFLPAPNSKEQEDDTTAEVQTAGSGSDTDSAGEIGRSGAAATRSAATPIRAAARRRERSTE